MLLLTPPIWAGVATGSDRFTGRVSHILAGPPQDPLIMPSDVAVELGGGIAVADGVNDRVVRFSSEGDVLGVISTFEGDALSRPLGVAPDAVEGLWIADTGHARAVHVDRSGRLQRKVRLPDQAAGEDYTDIVLASGGQVLFAVDNARHRLARVDLATGAARFFGTQGRAGDQLDYPFLVAGDGRGQVYVSDVINGRVAVHLEDGASAGHIGTFGVEIGQLYRPKGVACDSAGRVWISDGRMGVIQAFAADGRFLDVLRDARGEPLHFDTPSGLAFEAADRLFVVEVQSSRVVRVLIERDAASTATRSARQPLPGRQPQSCTVCHLEWMSPFLDGRGTQLLARPENPLNHPLVSRAENCMSCHDGSVVDSRLRVWSQHGHAAGVTPSAGMVVPSDLPLAQGQVVCRTCHTAHTRGGSGNALKDAVFVRVQSEAGELCVRCHSGLAQGPVAGMHPVAVHAPTSVALTSGPQAPQASATAPQCMTCHTPHGSSRRALLKPQWSVDQSCGDCHADIVERADCESGGAHPLSGSLEPWTAAAPAAADGSSSGLELGCLTCHRVHRASSSTHLLAADPRDGAVCLGCHAEQAGLIGTAHDLCESRPTWPNPRGEVCEVSGPCASCHAVHAPPHSGRPAAADESHCTVCHTADGCAGEISMQPFAHAVDVPREQVRGLLASLAPRRSDSGLDRLTCVVCHDPHQTAHSHFLRAAPFDLCMACHSGLTRNRSALQSTR